MEGTAESADPVVSARGLAVGYGARTLLHDLSFDVPRGQICALLGGSGSGKSTLMRTLVGLLPPLAGSVSLLGRPFASAGAPAGDAQAPLLRRVGVMFQGGALFGAMSVLENVEMPLREFTELPPALVLRCAMRRLEHVGLAPFAGRRPRELSGGMQKRAAIARALALDPPVLFLDEPSAGLDPATSAGLDELILRLRGEQGAAVVVVTHELPSIFRIADRALYLDRETGTLLADGAPAALRDASPHAAVRAFFNRSAAPEAPAFSVRASDRGP